MRSYSYATLRRGVSRHVVSSPREPPQTVMAWGPLLGLVTMRLGWDGLSDRLCGCFGPFVSELQQRTPGETSSAPSTLSVTQAALGGRKPVQGMYCLMETGQGMLRTNFWADNSAEEGLRITSLPIITIYTRSEIFLSFLENLTESLTLVGKTLRIRSKKKIYFVNSIRWLFRLISDAIYNFIESCHSLILCILKVFGLSEAYRLYPGPTFQWKNEPRLSRGWLTMHYAKRSQFYSKRTRVWLGAERDSV